MRLRFAPGLPSLAVSEGACRTPQTGGPKGDGLKQASNGGRLPGLRHRHGLEPILGLAREARQHQRNMITGMPVSRTGDDHAVAVDPSALAGRVQGEGHLGPDRKRDAAAKLDAALVEDHRIGRKLQLRLTGMHGHLLDRTGTRNHSFSRAHILPLD